jgi:hypothetical protein
LIRKPLAFIAVVVVYTHGTRIFIKGITDKPDLLDYLLKYARLSSERIRDKLLIFFLQKRSKGSFEPEGSAEAHSVR